MVKNVLALIGLIYVVKKGSDLLRDQPSREEIADALDKVWDKAQEIFQGKSQASGHS
ncbi:MAG: hypothetical protein LBI87_11855 [Candidatus Accumulibacter sp.]|jgi:hypothetical protein|nr:hypothetical protein [Accumulibacter sp.]